MDINTYRFGAPVPKHRTFLMEHYELIKKLVPCAAVLFLLLCLEV